MSVSLKQRRMGNACKADCAQPLHKPALREWGSAGERQDPCSPLRCCQHSLQTWSRICLTLLLDAAACGVLGGRRLHLASVCWRRGKRLMICCSVRIWSVFVSQRIVCCAGDMHGSEDDRFSGMPDRQHSHTAPGVSRLPIIPFPRLLSNTVVNYDRAADIPT